MSEPEILGNEAGLASHVLDYWERVDMYGLCECGGVRDARKKGLFAIEVFCTDCGLIARMPWFYRERSGGSQ